jgi:primosomal protein N' (replication factor Y)
MSANDEQQAAIDAICQTTDFKGFLLDGITGSGKTEVYLQATAHVLEAGKQVLVLVPEIGLTPQTLERFRNRFNRRLDCLHSGLTDPQRLAAWEAARLGQTAIVMGTRSALFTPLPHLGLIIVDEAHDASYKQQDGCRYHARDLALWRGQLENVPVLLGSATPALESLHLCRQRKLVSLPLRQRAGGALPPAMQLLDCHSLPSMQLLHPISIAASQRCLEEGQQVLLFLNRRGYAPLINCFKCGWQMECSRCNRFMTWHKHIERLVCHHCGNQKPVPRHCPTCGSSELGDLGAGTEKLEEYVQSIFPDHAVIRIDRDATRRKGSLEASLARIQTGGPALLVGTQMLAKGHHFPNLALTVILDADAGFLSADFRGAEQAGATILQVAGRTGRTGRAGQVLVQTRHPQMPLLQCITQGDWHAFADLILEERNQMGLPPFTHAALLTAEATRAEAAMAFLQLATNQLSNESYVTRLGPAPAPMEKRAGRYRFQMLLLSPHRPALQNALQRLLAGIESKPEARRCRWSVDVDPQDML